MKKTLLMLSITGILISCNTSAQKSKTEAKPTTVAIAPNKSSTNEAEKKVEITTDYGVIVVKLYNGTPLHRDNFLKLAKENFYDGTLFHRVISGFMIQGGDPNSKNASADQMLGNGDHGSKIPAEISPQFIHKKGALAAARDNNPEKKSSGCQFYIVQGKPVSEGELSMFEQKSGWKYTPEQKAEYLKSGGTPFLDAGYTVFGEVVRGLDVVDKIALLEKGNADRPKKDIKMSVQIVE